MTLIPDESDVLKVVLLGDRVHIKSLQSQTLVLFSRAVRIPRQLSPLRPLLFVKLKVLHDL